MRHALFVLLASCALALPGGAQAQQPLPTVTGIVTGSGNVALGGTRVQLLELHRDEETRQDGTFTFERVPPGHYTLVAQSIGYRPDSRVIQVTDTSRAIRISLVAAAFQLAPVVVTGTVSGRPSDATLSPTSVVTGAELDRRIEQTIAGTLQDQPGVSVASLGPTTGRPVIRGLSGDRIVILEDGERPGDLSSMSSDHAVAIDPLTAKQFEVVRGPMSLLYGSSAMGGVVNVIREEIPARLPTHLEGTASFQGSSVNRGGDAGFVALDRLGSLAVRAEGSARRSGDVDTPEGRLINTDAATYGAALSAAAVGARSHGGASYRYYLNDYGVPGGFVGTHPNGVDIHMERHTGRAEFERHLGPGDGTQALRATTQFTAYHHEEMSGGAVGTRFRQTIAAGDLTYRHDDLGPLAQLAIGTRTQFRDIVTGGSLHTPSTRDVTASGFLVGELGHGALRTQGGVRYDWAHYVPDASVISVGGENVSTVPRTFGSFSGSFGLLYSLTPALRVGSSITRSYRTPDFNELYSNGPHLADYSYNVGDPSLRQETGIGLDAFVRLSTSSFRGELAAYHNTLDDYIFPSSRGRAELGAQGGVPRFQYTNEGALFTGAEGELEWSVTPSIVIEGTASMVRARFTTVRAPIPVIAAGDTTFLPASPYPPFIPPVNGRAGIRYERPKYFAGIEVKMAAAQHRLGDGEDPTDGYATGDFSAGVRVLPRGRLHTITLRVENLTNATYRDHLSRVKVIMPEPGRNISLVYRFAF